MTHLARETAAVIVGLHRAGTPEPAFSLGLRGHSRPCATRDLPILAISRHPPSGLVPTGALATHRASLAESPSRFPEWIKPETGAIKVLIEI